MRTAALQTAMDTVLGRSAGNGLEVTESVETLEGGGPADLVEVTVALARAMLGLDRARRATIPPTSSRPVARCRCGARWSPRRAATPTRRSRPRAEIETVHAHRSGILTRLDARAIGNCAWRLGAGRARKEHPVSPSAGVVCRVKPGEPVAEGAVLLELHVDDPARLDGARDALDGAYEIGDARTARTSPRPRPHRIAPNVKRLSICLALVALACALAACASDDDSDAAVVRRPPTPALRRPRRPRVHRHDRPRRSHASTSTSHGTPRDALVHLPAGWDGTTSVPLVLSFHGLGSNAAQQMSNDNFSALADQQRLHRRLSECGRRSRPPRRGVEARERRRRCAVRRRTARRPRTEGVHRSRTVSTRPASPTAAR